MPNLTVAQARNQFSDLINRVAYGKERVVLTRRGKALAAIVPLEDIQKLNAIVPQPDSQHSGSPLEFLRQSNTSNK